MGRTRTKSIVSDVEYFCGYDDECQNNDWIQYAIPANLHSRTEAGKPTEWEVASSTTEISDSEYGDDDLDHESTKGDDSRDSMEIKPNRRHITFQDRVDVLIIPSLSSLSEFNKNQMWYSAAELNQLRNTAVIE
uniref:AlNc14C189G8405 protein n=1 Tax=Albugo laibachii Nc14 TaxID=890382 RepID=F0WPR3_9STRA|nr:AlNc14C189G8405 [Albugo laibachii Nc14]|eukprot:CCA23314.1 AlNc14C189G8405 [Albugo laibachii Nc14]